MLIVFQPKKTILSPMNQKTCVIGETKAKLFATTLNQYKYQLTVTSC